MPVDLSFVNLSALADGPDSQFVHTGLDEPVGHKRISDNFTIDELSLVRPERTLEKGRNRLADQSFSGKDEAEELPS